MTYFDHQLAWLDRVSFDAFNVISAERRLACIALVALALTTYLPGVARLPAVDRTEIQYASATRQMIETGNIADPRYEGKALDGKPIGTFWLQMAPSAFAPDDITSYRLPSLIGVILAVLATFWLLAPVLSPRGALIAAALLAVTPILAVQANLAVTEGAVLGAAVVAQLALLRIYVSRSSEPRRPFALAFWIAQGFAILLNALAVPLLSIATIIALIIFDRKFGWLRRLEPLWGLPLMALIGAPWLITRAIADGGMPFRGMGWDEFLAVLGGSQSDQFRAAPASFTLAFLLGFLPGTLLIVPAARRLWFGRNEALPRFLLAWIIGYLVYLELISGKPALYTVQVLFPAAAAAVVLAMMGTAPRDGRSTGPLPLVGRARGGGIPTMAVLESPPPSLPRKGGGTPPQAPLTFPPYVWAPPWWLPAGFILIVIGAVLWLTATWPPFLVVIGSLLVATLFALAARALEFRLIAAWLALSIIGFSVFLSFTFGLFLPSLETPWPARRMAEAIAPLRSCASGPAGVLGFREPSGRFMLGRDTVEATPAQAANWTASDKPGILLVEDRWHEEFTRELRAAETAMPRRVGCVSAYNVMRGCSLSFSIYLTGRPSGTAGLCSPAPGHDCRRGALASIVPDATRSRCK